MPLQLPPSLFNFFFSLAPPPHQPSRFISLRYHSRALIDACDFRALKAFERAHPELFVGAPAHRARGQWAILRYYRSWLPLR